MGRRGGRDLDGLRGIGDAPVGAFPVRELDAFVSRHRGGPPEPTAEALVRHDAVCSALMEAGPVAPVRFGAAFTGAERLRSSIAGRLNVLHAALERVDGCVELGVRVLRHDTPPAEPAATGAAYLHRRLEARRAGRSAVVAVDERLRPLARDARVRPSEAPGLPAALTYLVPRDGVERFGNAVAAADDAHPDLALVCTGPWPPYSFVSEDT